jgi:hypothetical protein
MINQKNKFTKNCYVIEDIIKIKFQDAQEKFKPNGAKIRLTG